MSETATETQASLSHSSAKRVGCCGRDRECEYSPPRVYEQGGAFRAVRCTKRPPFGSRSLVCGYSSTRTKRTFRQQNSPPPCAPLLSLSYHHDWGSVSEAARRGCFGATAAAVPTAAATSAATSAAAAAASASATPTTPAPSASTATAAAATLARAATAAAAAACCEPDPTASDEAAALTDALQAYGVSRPLGASSPAEATAAAAAGIVFDIFGIPAASAGSGDGGNSNLQWTQQQQQMQQLQQLQQMEQHEQQELLRRLQAVLDGRRALPSDEATVATAAGNELAAAFAP
ncbi:hypothetical protein HK405_013206, partial [Cladochytrium tenue]